MVKKNNDSGYKVFYMLIGMGIGGAISFGVALGNLVVIDMLLGTLVDCLVYITKRNKRSN